MMPPWPADSAAQVGPVDWRPARWNSACIAISIKPGFYQSWFNGKLVFSKGSSSYLNSTKYQYVSSEFALRVDVKSKKVF